VNRVRRPALFIAALATSLCLHAADTEPRAGAVESQQILEELRAFETLGSVLHVGAHPDDENTQLVAYLARGRGYRTAYLSLTRGDGGQNELGPEFGEKLGLARTEELLAARKIDGGEQFFTRAMDFGFSKTPEETLRIWDRPQVLADVVRVIREFCPDVIVTRFPIPPGSGGHGHHTASAILAVEAFKLAGDPSAFPEQLKEGLAPWQAKRIVWNAWSPNRQGPAPEGVKLDIGGADPVTGESFASIAAHSRAMHRTQGFGNFASRIGSAATPHEETFVLFGGDPAQKDILDDVETGWSRFEGGAPIAEEAGEAIAHFNASDPAASLPVLLKIRAQLTALVEKNAPQHIAGEPVTDRVLLEAKKHQIDDLVRKCLGLEVVTKVPNALVVPGEKMHLEFQVIERASAPVRWLDVSTPSGSLAANGRDLVPRQVATVSSIGAQDRLPSNTPATQPYWLRKDAAPGLFQVDDAALIGRPENPPVWPVNYHFQLSDGSTLTISDEPVQLRTDVSAAQVRQPLMAIPPVSMRFVAPVSIFHLGETKTIAVELTAARSAVSGELRVDLPKGWNAVPERQKFSIPDIGGTMHLSFQVTAPATQSEGRVHAYAKIGHGMYDTDRLEINYAHLPLLILQPRTEARVASFPFEIRGHRVGYISGAGDSTVDSLTELGYQVESIKGDNLSEKNLQRFDAIVVGVRAFNVRIDLSAHLPDLMAYIDAGGTVIEQYNRPNNLSTEKLGPYPFSLAGDAPRLRVTDENSPVDFLAPDDPALTTPNRITSSDFGNWVQERGAYYPSSWDEHYHPILAMHDPGEAPLKSGVLIARYGKGYFVYTSLSFFRQLPAANPGAYRLWANLISIGK